MCDFLKKIFGSSKPDPAAAQALAAAQAAANNALLAQKQAQDQARAAADSASEDDRLAAEARLRKLASAGTFGAAFNNTTGAAPTVATRTLFGSA